jgi:hypothetical protein
MEVVTVEAAAMVEEAVVVVEAAAVTAITETYTV